MELVIIGGQYRRIERILREITFEQITITFIKTLAPRIYIEVSGDLQYDEVARLIKCALKKDIILQNAFFEIYTLFNGKVDFVSYLPPEKKAKLKYFQ